MLIATANFTKNTTLSEIVNVEELDQPGEIGERAGQPVDPEKRLWGITSWQIDKQ